MSVALRRRVVVALSLAVFAGGAGAVVARQVKIADADPHDGVARAHTMPVQGIDVSNWQGDIDWDKVRAAGTQFAFITATEGGDYLDPKFAQNWQAAKRAGISRADVRQRVVQQLRDDIGVGMRHAAGGERGEQVVGERDIDQRIGQR